MRAVSVLVFYILCLQYLTSASPHPHDDFDRMMDEDVLSGFQAVATDTYTIRSPEARSAFNPEDPTEQQVISKEAEVDGNGGEDINNFQSPLWIGIFVVVPVLLLVIAAYVTMRCYSSRVGSTRASSVIYKAGSEPPHTPSTRPGETSQGNQGISTIDVVPYTYSVSASPYGNPTTEPI